MPASYPFLLSLPVSRSLNYTAALNKNDRHSTGPAHRTLSKCWTCGNRIPQKNRLYTGVRVLYNIKFVRVAIYPLPWEVATVLHYCMLNYCILQGDFKFKQKQPEEKE